MSTIIIGVTAIMFYLWTAYRMGLRLARSGQAAEPKKPILITGVLAIAAHGLLIGQSVILAGGINLSFFHASSLITWLINALLLLAAAVKPVENLVIPLMPLGALAVGLILAFPDTAVVLNNERAGLDAHIVISVLAFSLLNIAAIQAVLLAVQNRHLRNRHPGGFIRNLPPLETMEELLFQMIGLGFALQTISLVSGFIFLKDMFAQHMVHKTVLSITAWLVFAMLLYGRLQFGWRGRTAIRWTLGGFTSLLLAYFGSKMVLELILGRTSGA